MFKLFGNKKLFFLMFGFIFFIAIMGFTLGKREQMTWPEKFLKDTVSFAQGLLYVPAGYVAGFFEDLHSLRIVYEENKALKLTLSQYARDTARLNDLEAQNIRLKDSLNFTEKQKQEDNYKYHIAEVIAISPDANNRTLTINIGFKDGIKENMAVVSTKGLVGRVIRAFPFTANVQLISDLDDRLTDSKAISATIKGKDTSFGVVESYNQEKGMLLMTKINKDDPLAIGDLVISSGLGQVFPKGMIIGTVVSRDVGDFGITHTAWIKPAADLYHLREVFVVEVPEG